MSSVLGLNAAPSTATRVPPEASRRSSSRARSTMRARRRRLISSTSRRKVSAWSTPSSPARAMNARMSLGRQPPPKPSPALQEPAADPVVVAERLGQLRDVGAGRLAHLGHRVDERDLGGQEGVRGDLDQLGGREVGDHHRRAGLEHRRVTSRRRCSAPRRDSTPKTIRSGRRVSSTAKPSRRNSGFQASSTPRRRADSAQPRRQPGRGADRHRRLADHERTGRRRCGASASNGGVDVAQVGGVLALLSAGCRRRRSARRRTSAASAKEVVNRSRPAARCLRSSSGRPGLVERHLARGQPGDLVASTSTPSTSWPSSAMQAAWVAPR